MKKSIIVTTLFTVLPCVGHAQTQTTYGYPYSYNEQEYYQVAPTQSHPLRLFVAINTTIYNNIKYKESGEYIQTYKKNTTTLNNGGSIGIGVDINNGLFQLSFDPAYQKTKTSSETSLKLRADISLMPGTFRPYISAFGGLITVERDDYDIDESTFGYGVGIGAKYYINDNIFADLGLNYSKISFDIDLQDVDVTAEYTGIRLYAGFGYRF